MAIRGVLFDLDGTLYQQGRAVTGAPEAVAQCRRAGLPVGFVTNTTSRPRRVIQARLEGYGFAIEAAEISSALLAGAAWLRTNGVTRAAAYVPEAAQEDLAGVTITDERPDAVLVGDLDTGWDFAHLNGAFLHLMHGARLVALSRDRYWLSEQGLRLDSGTIVAALEYAAGAESLLCGKPSATFYEAALGALGDGLAPADVLMVGDDLWGDIQGAQRLGFRTCLVRSGKFREDVFRASGVTPDVVVDSVADVPPLLDHPAR